MGGNVSAALIMVLSTANRTTAARQLATDGDVNVQQMASGGLTPANYWSTDGSDINGHRSTYNPVLAKMGGWGESGRP